MGLKEEEISEWKGRGKEREGRKEEMSGKVENRKTGEEERWVEKRAEAVSNAHELYTGRNSDVKRGKDDEPLSGT